MSANRINHEPVFLLSASPWRESSLWLEAFSRRYGRVALLARSARKRQSELRGVLVPFVPVSASWYGSQELKTLHRAEWVGGWPLPQGQALFGGLYVNEIMQKLTPREDAMPALYDALERVMRVLCTESQTAAELRRFEWTLLSSLGYAPDLSGDSNGSPIDADTRYWLRPEEAVMPLALAHRLDVHRARGIVADGKTLLQLREGVFESGESLQQALRINRLLMDFRLPEGIKSRQVLQQLKQLGAPGV